jgi:elongation factor G
VANRPASGPRCAAIVGTYLSGKTTLLEAILTRCGAVTRRGKVTDGNTVGDAAPESRARQMSVEMNLASCTYLDEPWTFIDCPGNVELFQETMAALTVADAAIVVVEPGTDKVIGITRVLKELDTRRMPYLIFVNKIDAAEASVRETLDALQRLTERTLVLRELPIRDGETVTGYVDLVSERAWKFKDNGGGPSDLIEIPASVLEREKQERTQLLEALADYDDTLMEELLEDKVPGTEEIYANLTKDLQEGMIVPVFFGSADQDRGTRRLLKALRHETPDVAKTVERLGLEGSGEALAVVFKTYNGASAGKLSFARVLRGEIADGATLNGTRVGGIFKMMGHTQTKVAKAAAGDVVALARLEDIKTGTALSPSGKAKGPDWPAPLKPVFALAVHPGNRDDEVKLASAMHKILDEDPSLIYGPNPDTGQTVLRGQGETHLRIAMEKLKNRNKVGIEFALPQVAYKETIRKPVSQYARHKKQSGGHGQFGDVTVEIKPLPRGSGFQFTDKIKGGVVPGQYIPAVEAGVKEYLSRGPLGFPVVDVGVELVDGKYHPVDSSEMAFKTAGGLAMREGMPKASPVLLEPIFAVSISVPTEFTSRVQRLISGRRGQILGFTAKDGWIGWDEVAAHLPESEILDLINELRSLTQGTASFEWKFDRLQEFTGREAEEVVASRNSAATATAH